MATSDRTGTDPRGGDPPDASAQRVYDFIRDGCYVESIHSEDGRELGLVVYGMRQLLDICAASGITDASPEDVSRWLSRSSQPRTHRLGIVAAQLLRAYHEEEDELHLPKPLEIVEDAEALTRQRDDWARGLDWLALHFEFSQPAKKQLGDAFVTLVAAAEEPGSINPDLETLSLGDYLARAMQTGNVAAIDAFCGWSRTSARPAKREED